MYSAIFIDTNVYESTKFNFDAGYLEQLKQLRLRPENLVFEKVIYEEVLNHYFQQLLEGRRFLRKGIRESFARKFIASGVRGKLLDLCVSDKEVFVKAREDVASFFEECGAIDIGDEYHNLKEVLEKYFSTSPPFENKDNKKHEFPDAIALVAMLNYALDHDVKVVVVSKDQGWHDFAKSTDGALHPVEDISSALDILQDFEPREYYSNIVNRYWSEVESKIVKAVEQNVTDSYGDYSLVVADSAYNHHYEIEEVMVDSVDFLRGNEELTLKLISLPEVDFGDEFVVSLKADVSFGVSVSFTFSVWDSIDKDEVVIGSSSEELELKSPLDVLLTLEFVEDELFVSEIEVQFIPEVIRFYNVGPDF